jgi:signal transduction histidine kinase
MEKPLEKDTLVEEDAYQHKARLRDVLDMDLRDSLPTVALIFGVLFAFFAVSHAFVLPRDIAPVMITLAALTSLLNFGLLWALRRWELPFRWAHPVAAADTLLALLNILLHLYLTADPLQTTNVTLLLIGAGFVVFSTAWWGLIVAITTLGWIGVALLIGPNPAWTHFAFALVSALAVSLLVHVIHRRTYVRIARLRVQDRQQRAKLEQTLRTTERIQRALQTTMDVAQNITTVFDLETLLNHVCALIKEDYGYYHVGIFLLDETGKFVVARAGTGEIGRALCEQGRRLAVGKDGVVGWVAAHRQVANVSNIAEDPRYIALQETALPETVTGEAAAIFSELALPLEVAGQLLGVLNIEHDTPGAFNAEDVQVLDALADQVAVAIQNASNYQAEQMRRQITERLYTVGMALSRSLDLTEILNLILTGLIDIVPFDRGSVMLEYGGQVVVVAEKGFPPGTQPLDVRVHIKENDVFQDLRRTQRPLLIPDVQQRTDWHYVENLPPARSWLGVPLVYQETVIGMLSLTREHPNPYTEDEEALAVTFASQAAMAIQNALLYENLSTVNRELEKTVQQLSERTRDLQVAYQQLERLDRTKSDFISVASHELRTPLTVISGYNQMLLDDPQVKKNDAYSQIVAGIQSGIARMEVIVGSILDMAKIDGRVLQLHPEPLILSLLIQSVRATLADVCRQRYLTLELKGLEDLPVIEADTEAMRKAIYHLLVNALKYTPDGGTITVSGRTLPPDDAEYPDGGVEIIVSDTGIGIDPSVQELIFTKFYQTGEVLIHSSGTTTFKGGGPGLGLAITRGIVEAHGGKIWAESPGYDEQACPGSHFHIVLPRVLRILQHGAMENFGSPANSQR